MSDQRTSGCGYFAIGQDTFHEACELGLIEAAAFLVISRGSQRDDVTTAWSAKAVAERLAIRWQRAKDALENLEWYGMLSVVQGGTKPIYKLTKEGDTVILPNSLIDGASGELSPVRRVRQMQDVMSLQLLVDLYGVQNLPAYGGVDPWVIRALWAEPEQIGQRGDVVAWRFTETCDSIHARWNSVTEPHRLDESDFPEDGHDASALWRRYHLLQNEGLLSIVGVIHEGEEGEPLFPVTWDADVAAEQELRRSIDRAAEVVMPVWEQDYGDIVVPLPSRFTAPVLKGMIRLRYRPHTKGTKSWFSQTTARCRLYQEFYDRIAQGETAYTRYFGVTLPRAAGKETA